MYNLNFQWRIEAAQRILTINGKDQPWSIYWDATGDKDLGEHAVVQHAGERRCIALSMVDAQTIAELLCRRAIARTIVGGAA